MSTKRKKSTTKEVTSKKKVETKDSEKKKRLVLTELDASDVRAGGIPGWEPDSDSL